MTEANNGIVQVKSDLQACGVVCQRVKQQCGEASGSVLDKLLRISSLDFGPPALSPAKFAKECGHLS